MKKDKIILGERLSAVAAFVREGVTLYDIGSDHAYLPCALLQQNKIPFAYVCDIAEGPLCRAEITVNHAEVADRVKLCLSDGLKNVSVVPPGDIAIAGMGGEMICSIIENAPEVKDSRIRLILQPMTKPELLRRYLSSNGFAFESERTVCEGKLYTVMVCTFSGTKTELSETELLIGKEGIREESPEFFELVKKKLDTLRCIAKGKRDGKMNSEYEDEASLSLEKILERMK